MEKQPSGNARDIALPSIPALLATLTALTGMYVVAKAAMMSMTHDESTTYLYSMKPPEWDILFPKIPSGNNHTLNSLLGKWSIFLFGQDAIWVRLPNVLAFFGYAYAAARLSLTWFESRSGAIAAWMLLVLNPFLLDFFTVARGYGLGISCMLLSLWQLQQFLRAPLSRPFWTVWFWAMLAVMSNFSLLNYFVALAGVWCAYTLLNYRTYQRAQWLRWWGMAAAINLPWMLWAVTQLKALAGGVDYSFWGTRGFIADTLSSLVSDSFYNHQYFGSLTLHWTENVIHALAAMALLWAVVRLVRSRFRDTDDGVYWVLLLGLAVLSPVLQFYAFKTQFLIHRAALLYVPLFWTAVLVLFRPTASRAALPARIFLWVFALYMMVNTLRHANTGMLREWYYDEDTKSAMLEVRKRTTPGKRTMLATHWIFHPASNYYVETLPLFDVELAPYDKELRKDTAAEFYYVPQEDVPKLDSAYHAVCRFHFSVLMQRK